MAYFDGCVIAAPTARKAEYEAHVKRVAALFREFGALDSVEGWGDDVPEGALTSLPKAVQAREDETVCFSWVVWPSKEVRDAAWARMMTDPRMRESPAPFDGKRMIFGGFEVIGRD